MIVRRPCIGCPSAAIRFLVPEVDQWLRYERDAVVGGQLWRLVTGNWTHWSIDQLWWNVVALAALGAACERRGRGRFLICVGASALLVLLAVWGLAPAVETYRGLSGIASALFVLLAVSFLREEANGDRITSTLAALALLGFGAKVAFEVASGRTVFVDARSGAVVLPLAHVVGGLVGLAVALAPMPSALPPCHGLR